MEQYNGTITLFGTPAEENYGGKIKMLEEGAFDDVDFAIMIHPSSGHSLVKRGGRAATTVTMDFYGEAAHSCAPMYGINALNAVLATFRNIDMQRPMFHPQDNVNGIIPHGGTAPNAIPGYAQCVFSLRSDTLRHLRKLVEVVKHCGQQASDLVGTRMECTVSLMYGERYPNGPMGDAFKRNMEWLGEEIKVADNRRLYGSSDIGNVSMKLPSIHEYLAIDREYINSHAVEFTRAAETPRADEVCLHGAMGLAMTALDLLSDEALRKAAWDEYHALVPAEYQTK